MKNHFEMTPWLILTILGCALLSGIDYWRGLGPTSVPLIRGTLPNLIAVPTLTFGFLMILFPKRISNDPNQLSKQGRWFWSLWIFTLLITIGWEFLQLTGALVFDKNDIIATVIGAVLAISAFYLLRPLSIEHTSG